MDRTGPEWERDRKAGIGNEMNVWIAGTGKKKKEKRKRVLFPRLATLRPAGWLYT